MKTKKITCTDFGISYDGIYKLITSKKQFSICLTPQMFLALVEKEGYSANDLKKFEDECNPILFKKSSISIFQCIEDGKKSGYLTSELAEDLQQSNNLYLLDVEIN